MMCILYSNGWLFCLYWLILIVSLLWLTYDLANDLDSMSMNEHKTETDWKILTNYYSTSMYLVINHLIFQMFQTYGLFDIFHEVTLWHQSFVDV